jgi:hypothetical protein
MNVKKIFHLAYAESKDYVIIFVYKVDIKDM